MSEILPEDRLAEIREHAEKLFSDAEPASYDDTQTICCEVLAILASHDALMALAYVPGRWECTACPYTVSKSVLSTADGELYASKEDGGLCPNDGAKLVRVSWRKDAEFCRRFEDNLMTERDTLMASRQRCMETAAKAANEAIVEGKRADTLTALLRRTAEALEEVQAFTYTWSMPDHTWTKVNASLAELRDAGVLE